MIDVLLATCSDWPHGVSRTARTSCANSRTEVWGPSGGLDDPEVDWADARLVTIRSVWDCGR